MSQDKEREINLSRHFEINDNLQIDLEDNMIYFSDTPHAMVVSCSIKEIKLLISILREMEELEKDDHY